MTHVYTDLGRQGGGRQRPIITRFLSWKQRTNVLESARTKLKGSGSAIRIGEDFSKEVRETRRRLYPALKTARDSDKMASLRYDKLYIDNKPFILAENGEVVPLRHNPRVQSAHQ